MRNPVLFRVIPCISVVQLFIETFVEMDRNLD
jgi:hypothetical protein